MAKGDQINDVLIYVQNHAGERIDISQLRRATGYTTIQCQNSMRTIKMRGLWPLAVIIQGRIWRAGVSDTVLDPVDRPIRTGSLEAPVVPEEEETRWDRLRRAGVIPEDLEDKTVTDDQAEYLFEYLGARPHGKLLLRRDDGQLFEATLEKL